ncbi:titin isoform X2, partial [Clarias magur]
RSTPSPPHGGLPSDHRLVTVGNELRGLSQRTGADIPYARDYSPHQSSYEVHDERNSSRHSHSHYGNRGWSHSPDRIHSRIRLRSRSRSPAGCRIRAVNQEHRRPRSRSRSRGRSWSKNSNSVKEDSRELKGAYLSKELEDMLKMPTKSILKKKVVSLETDSSMIRRMDLTSPGQCDYFPVSKQPTNDDLTFLRSSEPSDTAFKSTCNSSSVLSNTVDLFRRLINEASTGSHKFNNKAIVYDQKSSREMKAQSSSTLASHLSQFSHHNCDQASTSESFSIQSSATEQKSNLATQMDRFLGALNKGDSNFLSSLVKHTRKDTDRMGNQRISQEQARRIVSDNLYDRGEDNSPLMGSKQHMNPMFGRVDKTQDDLLPHERAVVDGSGFSKIVGMKCGVEANPENRFLHGEAIPSSNQSRRLEKPKKFLNDKFKWSQDRIDMAHLEDLYAEERKRHKSAAESYRIEGSLSPVHHKSEDQEDTDQKASQYKKLQDLLQTIGLNLDTTEVSKLADRTNERLYGKKINLRSSRSFDQKDDPSVSRYDQRGSSNSTNSEDVASVSPAKTSNRDVYKSYLDSLKNQPDEVAVRERDLSTLRDIPEAKRSDPYKTMPLVGPHDPYKPPAEEPLLAQSVSLPYTPLSSEFTSPALNFKNKQDVQNYSYTMGGEQNPYGSISPNPLHYTTGYPIPPAHPMLPSSFPSGYAYYRPPASPLSMMPPSPAQFFPSLFNFNTPTFGPPPAPPYPPPLGHFGFAMQPGSSGYVTHQAKTKAPVKNRCLKTIETIQTQESVSCNIFAVKEVCTDISIQTEKEHKDTEDEAESQTVPTMEDDIKTKQEKR